MAEQIWCANCENVRDVTIHGRCGSCDSAAVCIAAPGPKAELAELERLFRLTAAKPV